MTRYFRITSAIERALWEDFRTQWKTHRDAVLAFMNDELKAESVRCNHFGAPIMAQFKKNMSEERNVAESYFQLTTDRQGFQTMNRKGIKHFEAKLSAIADLFPRKLPGQCAEYRQNFSVVPVWQSEETPIYLVVKSDQVRLGLPFPYREMSEEEYTFRTAADDFRVAAPTKYIETLDALFYSRPVGTPSEPPRADTMIRTDDCASAKVLRELFSMDDDDPTLENVIAVCDGEWVFESADTWRFWKHNTGDAE